MSELLQRYTHILKNIWERSTKPVIQWFDQNRWVYLLLLLLVYMVVTSKMNSKLVQLKGKQSRNYSIKYLINDRTNYQTEIESLLDKVEQALDATNMDSEVAHFNNCNSEPFYYQTPFLYPLLIKSKEVYNYTQGAFDPTVAPFVKLWKKKLQAGKRPTELDIRPLQHSVSLDYIMVNEQRIKKLKEEVTIDLNGLIYSYEADVIANFLQSKAIKDFYIQVGDEARVHGVKENQKPWKKAHHIKVHPSTEEPFDIRVNLQDKAISAITYTDEYNSDDMNIVINPHTGRLSTNSILAVFVLANDCLTARSYAIAFMAKDATTTIELASQMKNIEVFLAYKGKAGKTQFYHSKGLEVKHTEGSQKIYIQMANKSALSPITQDVSANDAKEEE